MSNSQNIENEQQNNLCTTSEQLTEQLKKGELKIGFYYVYLKYLEMFDIAASSTLFEVLEIGNENSLEVLAPVPSYEEWQEKQKSLKVLTEAYCKEKEENQQLKELLRECVEVLNDAQRNYRYDDSIIDICLPIITKINNAVGEKK